MDEVYVVSPLRLTAGLRRTFLSREDYTALGDETTRRELEKLKATREFASRAAEMQRREEHLRQNARQRECWKHICFVAQAALVALLVSASLATSVVLFANIFPASMGLTSPRLQPPDSRESSAALISEIDTPDSDLVQAHVRVTAEPSLQIQDDFQKSSYIAPFFFDTESTCLNVFLESWQGEVAAAADLLSHAGADRPENTAVVTWQPVDEAVYAQSTFSADCDTAAMTCWDATTSPIHGSNIPDEAVVPIVDPDLQPALPRGRIDDVPEAVSTVDETDDLLSPGGFLPALPLPKSYMALSVFTSPVQLLTPQPASPDPVMSDAVPHTAAENPSVSSLLHKNDLSAATSNHDIVPRAEMCSIRVLTAHTLLPSKISISGPWDEPAKLSQLRAYPVSVVYEDQTMPTVPATPHREQTIIAEKFTAESMAILRGVWQGSFCVDSDQEAILEQRLMGVKSITMPPLHVMRVVANACGAAASFHITAAISASSFATTQLAVALQHEPVAHAAAWLMLLVAMIAAAYVLLSTEGVAEAECSPKAASGAVPMSFNLHFRSDALPGRQGSPAYHPGQLFPSNADEQRESSGSPIAAGVGSRSTERRITPEPIATAGPSLHCSGSAAPGASESSSPTGSIAEVGPTAHSQACAPSSDIPTAAQAIEAEENVLDDVNYVSDLAARVVVLEQQLREEKESTAGKETWIAELDEKANTAVSEMAAFQARMVAAQEQSHALTERTDELEVRLAAEVARADTAEAALAQLEASAAMKAVVDAAVEEVTHDHGHRAAGSVSPANVATQGDKVLDCLAQVSHECDQLEAAQQELTAACASHGAQGAALQELLKTAQMTLDTVQLQREEGGPIDRDEELWRRGEAATEEVKKAVDNMLCQIQLLVEPTQYLAKRVYGQVLPEPQLFGENWHYEACNVMKQAAVQLDAAEAAEHTVMAVVRELLEGGDVSGVSIDDAEISEAMAKQLRRLKSFAIEAWASRDAVMQAASGLANAVDAPALSAKLCGWEWSSEVKGVLDKAVAEVSRLQAAEEGVIDALEVMLESDDLQLQNSSVSSAAAEGLTRVHFQLQQASGRETDLATQVNKLVQRQIELEKQLRCLESSDEDGLSGSNAVGRHSETLGYPGPSWSNRLHDKHSTWLQRCDRLVDASASLTVVKVHLNVLPDGYITPILEVQSPTQAGLTSVRGKLQSLLEDGVLPSSHSRASQVPAPGSACAGRISLHSLDRNTGFVDERGNTQDCFHPAKEIPAPGSDSGSHTVKDGAVELQRVLENAAVHAGSCEMPQVVFDSTVVAHQVEARYARLEAEYGDTHLTAGEGHALHKYLSETLEHAVSSLSTPSASEASYSGNTENEDCDATEAHLGECSQLWMGKFGEQQMYVDVVAQNLNGLVDEQARFLHCLAELVSCQEQQETARLAHEALHQRVTQCREALSDGSISAGPPSDGVRRLSANRDALFAKLVGLEPRDAQSRDLDNVMDEFNELEKELAEHGSPREEPVDLPQLQHDLRQLEDLQAMMRVSAAQLQEDVAHARASMCSTVEVIHENTLSLLEFFTERGLRMPQEVSTVVNKMAAQVAHADGGDLGAPPAARGLAAVLSGAATPMSDSIAKVQDWQSNPSMLDSLSPVLHFGSACVDSAAQEPAPSTGGILLDSSRSSALAQASPVWAGIPDFTAPSPRASDDPTVSPPQEPVAAARPSPPQPLQFAPLVFTMSAPEMIIPTPTFGPTPFHTAARAPPTRDSSSPVPATPRTSMKPFQTPCGTEPSSDAQASASGTVPSLSPLTGAESAAEAEDFLARQPHAGHAGPAAEDSGGSRFTPRIAGVTSEIPRPAAAAASRQPTSASSTAPQGIQEPGASPRARAAAVGVTADGAGEAGDRPDRLSGIRRSIAAGPRRSLQPQQLGHSRLPRAPGRQSAPAHVTEPSPAILELIQSEPTPPAPLAINSPLPTSLPFAMPALPNLPEDPSGSTVGIPSGPSIPSAPASQVTQKEPSPPAAQAMQQPMPCVPPLMPSVSPLVPRSRPSPTAAASTDSDKSAPSQLKQQDVRQGVAVSPHVWQRAIHDARQPSVPAEEDAAPMSPRNCMASMAGQPAAVSLLDIDLAPTPGLEVSIGAIGEMSPITEDWRGSPVASPSSAAPGNVLLTTNALFDAPTPISDPADSSGGRNEHITKAAAGWKGRHISDENSCENLPVFRGQ